MKTKKSLLACAIVIGLGGASAVAQSGDAAGPLAEMAYMLPYEQATVHPDMVGFLLPCDFSRLFEVL